MFFLIFFIFIFPPSVTGLVKLIHLKENPNSKDLIYLNC